MRRREIIDGRDTRREYRHNYANMRTIKRKVRDAADSFALPNHQFEKRFSSFDLKLLVTSIKISNINFSINKG